MASHESEIEDFGYSLKQKGMFDTRPILVTGSPRSGTSWAGKMVGQAPFVRYIHEPFNISGYPCSCGQKFDYWFYYLSSKEKYYEHLEHLIYPAYSWVGFLNAVTKASLSKRIRPLGSYLRSYLLHRPLLKDPIALFSAEQLARWFNMDVIVLIRHPAAVVSSYKTLNWIHPLSHFLKQPELMNEHLLPYQSEIIEFSKNDHDIVEQAALLWRINHSIIKKYQKKHPKWIFIRHVDLALDPINGFQKIFNRLGLPFSERTWHVIENHSVKQELPKSTDPYSIKQDPHEVTSKWKKNLTFEEIYRIRELVEDVSAAFYSDEDWNL